MEWGSFQGLYESYYKDSINSDGLPLKGSLRVTIRVPQNRGLINSTRVPLEGSIRAAIGVTGYYSIGAFITRIGFWGVVSLVDLCGNQKGGTTTSH